MQNPGVSEFNSDDTKIQTTGTSHPNLMVFPPELAAQFAEFLRQSSSASATPKPKTPPTNHHPHHPESLGEITVNPKLNRENYPLWSNMMDRGIGGKGLTSHIDGVSSPPPDLILRSQNGNSATTAYLTGSSTTSRRI